MRNIFSDDCLFVATGITDGMLLWGVRKKENGLTTNTFIASGGKARGYQFLQHRH